MSNEQNGLNKRVESIEQKVDSVIKMLKDESEIRINNRTIINNNFIVLNEKIDKIRERVSSLHVDTNQNFDEVKIELVKIQATTQYDAQYDDLNVIKGKSKE